MTSEAQSALSHVRDEVWRSLAAAAGNPRAALGLFALATAGERGTSARMVVLRAVDAANATIYFCTDARSRKVREISWNNRVSALFFDAARARQYRLSGRATVHAGDALARMVWRSVSVAGRALMMSEAAPGTPLAQPAGISVTDEAARSVEPAPNFVAVAVAVSEIDYFDMSASPYRRALLSIAEPEVNSWIQP